MPNTKFKIGDIVQMYDYPGELFVVDKIWYYPPERLFYYIFRCVLPNHENEVIECSCSEAKKLWELAPRVARLLYKQ